MKLVLDEMYSHGIAEQLRARGHDADAVVERAELRGLADTEIFSLAQTEQRAVVTENIRDFSDIATDYDQRGQVYYGLVLLDRGRYPRASPGTIGRMVTALDRLLGEHPEETPTSMRHWL
ncbi:MAG: DUF5615 family PIN-like protein [Solirubrobacteraceae bacterium]